MYDAIVLTSIFLSASIIDLTAARYFFPSSSFSLPRPIKSIFGIFVPGALYKIREEPALPLISPCFKIEAI